MAAKHQIPCGNTEGWGPIFWYDHPEFIGMWEDIKWHQKMTRMIKGEK